MYIYIYIHINDDDDDDDDDSSTDPSEVGAGQLAGGGRRRLQGEACRGPRRDDTTSNSHSTSIVKYSW